MNSLIDAYDIMATSRSYKKAMRKEEALAEIKSCAGSQFLILSWQKSFWNDG